MSKEDPQSLTLLQLALRAMMIIVIVIPLAWVLVNAVSVRSGKVVREELDRQLDEVILGGKVIKPRERTP